MRCSHGPCIAALHVWVALTDRDVCMDASTFFAVGVGSSGVCMLQVLIVMFILVLNCKVL